MSGQSSGQRSRSRSCTTPGVPLDNPRSTGHNDIIARKGVKLRERSRSATMPNNMPVDLLKELTANLSVTQQTALLPEEESMTTASTGGTDSIKTSGNDNNQMRADTPQHNTSPHTDRAQNLSSSKETDCEMQTSEVPVGQIRVLPPVIRQGQLAMKVEVRRLKATKGANASDLNQKTHPSVDAREQNIEANGKVEKGLPHVLSAMERHSPKPLAVKSESKEGNNGQQRPITHQDVSSRSSPSSPVKVSIVSLGEAPTVRPRSQLQRRRKRRHSDGRPPGSGRLSQGWSPPQAIEPLVGSPLHTPRKWSQDKGRRDLANESNEKEFEARRSLMTSPGLMINVDVNEFLKDTEADDPA